MYHLHVNNKKISSILWVGYPGEAGGAAIADVIFGSYNPSGRLPITWHLSSYIDQVPMTNMNMRPDASGYPGRTYRFYKGKTLFPFGYGLSYSNFDYHLVDAPKIVTINLTKGQICNQCKSVILPEETCKNLAFGIKLKIKNLGEMSSSHTVLLFSTPPRVHNSPQNQLLGFEKVFLYGGAESLVKFEVDVCKHLSVVDELGIRKVTLGEHFLQVGSLNLLLAVEILK
ncbi:Beta-xylosidase/alpha-L-arabinofuranosidase-like protein [Quillaja saponaria]|uniref:Beta-xylosidase/alpha-L-arabinofuranosidase-like protein n=1 Tax=Quillaja saponaria TaxID=32244 RepID=A0AAD7PV96_QUISA|nr:Beta-xylosidase/alpha-L-arabinofuranosidase-like protein [Quillaja saponaria]